MKRSGSVFCHRFQVTGRQKSGTRKRVEGAGQNELKIYSENEYFPMFPDQIIVKQLTIKSLHS